MFQTRLLLCCGLLLLGLGFFAGGWDDVDQSPEKGEAKRSAERISPVTAAELLAEQCRQRAARLPQQLAQPVRALVRPPFVLAGDLPERELQAKYEAAVQPFCQSLVATHVRRLPEQAVLVLLFSTEAGYRQAAERLCFDRDVSRFGYYKPGRRAVIVNLAEGDGPLFHELTHVLMDADFPTAPRWLQEGLATLHEAVEFSTEHPAPSSARSSSEAADSSLRRCPAPDLLPLPNWRGAILRRAGADHRLPTLRQFLAQATFRGSREALDYAYARYLCLFLHQRGTLRRYYAVLRERAAIDPTGERTLLDVCAASDWDSLDAEFRGWVEADAGVGPSAADGSAPCEK